MQYKIHSTIAKLAHAQGFKVGGDYALYVLGVKARYLPRMNHLRLFGLSMDIDKFIKTLDVLYGVEILQKNMKPFVQKIYFKLKASQEKIHIYYSSLQESFIYSKDAIVLSGDGVEVMSPGTLNLLGARAMHTLEMTKRRELSLLQMVDGNITLLPETYVSSWDYITSQMDYIRAGWKIHPDDTWEIYINKNKVPSDFECSICQNSLEDVFNEEPTWIKTGCGHTFHYECLKQWIVSGDYGWKCPMCRSSKLILYKNCVP